MLWTLTSTSCGTTKANIFCIIYVQAYDNHGESTELASETINRFCAVQYSTVPCGAYLQVNPAGQSVHTCLPPTAKVPERHGRDSSLSGLGQR